MIAVLTAVPCRESGEYLAFQSKDPRKTYRKIARAGIIKPGEWTGINITREPRMRTESEYIQDEAPSWEPEGRNMCDSIEPAHWKPGKGHYKYFEVVDGYDEEVSISTSKRADIHRNGNQLLLASEIFNERKAAKLYKNALETKEVEQILNNTLTTKRATSLLHAFEAVRALKPSAPPRSARTGKYERSETPMRRP